MGDAYADHLLGSCLKRQTPKKQNCHAAAGDAPEGTPPALALNRRDSLSGRPRGVGGVRGGRSRRCRRLVSGVRLLGRSRLVAVDHDVDALGLDHSRRLPGHTREHERVGREGRHRAPSRVVAFGKGGPQLGDGTLSAATGYSDLDLMQSTRTVHRAAQADVDPRPPIVEVRGVCRLVSSRSQMVDLATCRDLAAQAGLLGRGELLLHQGGEFSVPDRLQLFLGHASFAQRLTPQQGLGVALEHEVQTLDPDLRSVLLGGDVDERRKEALVVDDNQSDAHSSDQLPAQVELGPEPRDVREVLGPPPALTFRLLGPHAVHDTRLLFSLPQVEQGGCADEHVPLARAPDIQVAEPRGGLASSLTGGQDQESMLVLVGQMPADSPEQRQDDGLALGSARIAQLGAATPLADHVGDGSAGHVSSFGFNANPQRKWPDGRTESGHARPSEVCAPTKVHTESSKYSKKVFRAFCVLLLSAFSNFLAKTLNFNLNKFCVCTSRKGSLGPASTRCILHFSTQDLVVKEQICNASPGDEGVTTSLL